MNLASQALFLGLPIVKYPLIYLVAIVEGPVLMLLSGFILHLGYVSFWPLYVALIAGDLTGDVLWYGVGHYYAHPFLRRFGRYFSLNEALLDTMVTTFKRHETKILLLSKITMGLGFAVLVLIAAGWARVRLSKFLAFNFVGQCLWTGILVSIGYFFGKLYLLADESLRIVSLIGFLVTIVAALYGVQRFLRQRNFHSLP